MPKEALLEELVKRDGGGGGLDQQHEEPVWTSTYAGALGNLSLSTIITLVSVCAGVLALCLACVVCCARRGANANKKKKHNFGIRKVGYFRDKTCGPAKPPRNPTPVTNPDKGSHYLKKSPSPTGVKSPPGGATSAEDYLQKKALIGQAKKSSPAVTPTIYTEVSETYDEEGNNLASSSGIRRSSSGFELTTDGALGSLHCSVRYCFDRCALIVTVNKCVNLPAKDATAKSSDPYVKVQLLPEKQHKVKTRVMRRTLNPVYDEDFTFYGVQFNQIKTLTLHFVVLSFDRYSRDDVIGEVMVDLTDLDLSASDHQPLAINREITPRSYKLKTQGRGEILVSLCYQPAAHRVTAVVLKASNLPKMDITGLSDPYCKVYMLYKGRRIDKKKTGIRKRTLNPVYNESFIFDLPRGVGVDTEEGLDNIGFEFVLLDWDRVTKNEVIGRLELSGTTSVGSALHHWNEVLSSPRRQIAEWHKLKE